MNKELYPNFHPGIELDMETELADVQSVNWFSKLKHSACKLFQKINPWFTSKTNSCLRNTINTELKKPAASGLFYFLSM